MLFDAIEVGMREIAPPKPLKALSEHERREREIVIDFAAGLLGLLRVDISELEECVFKCTSSVAVIAPHVVDQSKVEAAHGAFVGLALKDLDFLIDQDSAY